MNTPSILPFGRTSNEETVGKQTPKGGLSIAWERCALADLLDAGEGALFFTI